MTRRHWEYAPLVLLGGLVAADWDAASCPDCFHEGYEVELSALPLLGTPPAAVLFSGYRNGRCEDDLICTASSDIVWLGDLGKATSSFNWWNSCGGEREMVVFAGEHAPTPLHPSAGDVPPIQPTLADRAVLKLAVWVEPGPAVLHDTDLRTPAEAATFELGQTQLIFDALGAGIKLDYTVHDLPATIPEDVKDILTEATCDIAKTLMNGVANGDMASMQDPARLNVYFVRSTHYYEDGLTCPGYKDQKPNSDRYVIFVANVEHTPSTLAHEIGHALGLVLRAALPGGTEGQFGGDVNELDLDPYLPPDNLMYSGVGKVGQITVGEVYRMHFDKRSWLRRGVTATGGYPRDCQASPVAGGPCPPLTLHPTRGWP